MHLLTTNKSAQTYDVYGFVFGYGSGTVPLKLPLRSNCGPNRGGGGCLQQTKCKLLSSGVNVPVLCLTR